MTDIAHLNLAAGFRGGERQTQMLIEALTKLGFRQRLIARKNDALANRLRGQSDLEIVEVSGILGAARAVRGAKLSHAHEGRCVQASALARLMVNTPYVITRRVTRPLKRNPITRAIYRNAAALVGLSSAIVTNVNAYTGRSTARQIPSALTPTDANPELVAELRARFGPSPIIGNVGALVVRHKGQDALIDVARRRPEWQFVLVGSGSDEQALKQAADGLENVHFTGQVDDVASHLAAFDIFAFPSRFEGLGSIVLDAMAQRIPVVASAVDGLPDLVTHEETGLLVPPQDSPALESAIGRLVEDDSARNHCIEQAERRMQDYTPERMAERYAALYAELGVHAS
ncbi:MAG: glycosyltransferase family 4 protein [Pseudomonadota bacterium]